MNMMDEQSESPVAGWEPKGEISEPTRGDAESKTSLGGPSLLWAMILAAMAGGLAWGIRGQYGHETGAAIAGLLVGGVLVFLFSGSGLTSLAAMRTVAWMAIGISIGGCMTYGQTIGLTHDASLVGNWNALGWGMLGLAVKGGIWIGLAGAFLGMGLSGFRYRALEVGLLAWALLFLLFFGLWWLNEPFDPENGLLPQIYFSDSWYWEPDADLEPRPEKWGGLLMVLAGLWIYLAAFKQDRLARNLALWGVLAGAIGFPTGQCLQACHAWNTEWFASGWRASLDQNLNWWNLMETAFGVVFGAVLALGLWIHRGLLPSKRFLERVEIKPSAEWTLAAIYTAALAVWNFLSIPAFDRFADLAWTMAVLPLVAVAAGRLWPYLLVFPIAVLPIAGKTVNQLVYKEDWISMAIGWGILFALPVVLAFLVAIYDATRQRSRRSAIPPLRGGLFVLVWIYMGLNWAVFHCPWPWREWTNRTPHGIIFAAFAVILSLAVLFYRPKPLAMAAESPAPAAEEPARSETAAEPETSAPPEAGPESLPPPPDSSREPPPTPPV